MATALPPPGSPDVLYLVDLSSYVFRAYHAIAPLSNTKGEPTHATYGTVAMLQKLVGEVRGLALADDGLERANVSPRDLHRLQSDPLGAAARSRASDGAFARNR